MWNSVYLILCAGLVAFGVLLWRLTSRQDAHKTAAFCLWLGAYACLANTPLVSPFIQPELAILGDNLSLYAGLPLTALVLLDLAVGWHWKRATWGRIFLALAAMFELMRRAEVGNYYGQFVLIASALIVLYCIYHIIKNKRLAQQSIHKPAIALSYYLALMVASLWSFNTSMALLWTTLTFLAFGRYLYFSA